MNLHQVHRFFKRELDFLFPRSRLLNKRNLYHSGQAQNLCENLSRRQRCMPPVDRISRSQVFLFSVFIALIF